MDDVLRYAGQRVIVTGAAGGVGAAVTALLVELGAEVHAIDAQRPPSRGFASFTETDLRDPQQLEAAVGKIGSVVNALFGCAPVPDDASLRHLVEHAVPTMIPVSAIVTVASTPETARARAEFTTSRAPALASEHGIRLNCVQADDQRPDDTAWLLLFLNSPRSSLVTGAVLPPLR